MLTLTLTIYIFTYMYVNIHNKWLDWVLAAHHTRIHEFISVMQMKSLSNYWNLAIQSRQSVYIKYIYVHTYSSPFGCVLLYTITNLVIRLILDFNKRYAIFFVYLFYLFNRMWLKIYLFIYLRVRVSRFQLNFQTRGVMLS